MPDERSARPEMLSIDGDPSPSSGYKSHKYSWETPPEPVDESQIAETIESDVVIVGGGIAGYAAAARCAQLGLRAVLLEKLNNFVAHGAHMAVLDSKCMRENGVFIDKKQFARDWMHICGSRVNEDLLWMYINRSPEAFEWFLEQGGDDIEVKLHGGNYRGPDFKEYDGTHFIVQADKPVKKYKLFGLLLACEILHATATEHGAQVFRQTEGKYLEKKDGRVTAAIAACPDGKYRRYKARKAVILATGDIAGNPELVEKFCPLGLLPERIGAFPKNSNLGEGHLMGYWAGGAFEAAPWALSLHLIAYAMYCFFFLHVNRRGQRFMNEDTWAQAKSIRILMQQPGQFAFSVFDSKYYDELARLAQYSGGQFTDPLIHIYGVPWDNETNNVPQTIDAYIEKGYAFKADTIEELAEKIGVPAENLLKTVGRYNENYRIGEDRDYGKRSILLTSIDKPPYYALKFGPALLTVFGGLLTDTNLRVLDSNHEPVPGLYAVGNCAGGLHGQDYPLLLNGNASGKAITWGKICAEAIAKDE